MFSNLGFSELLIVGLIALLLFGPDKLPEVLRTFGKGMREFRKAVSDVENEIKDSLEGEMKKKTPEQKPEDKKD
jgi:TatA/E family protein of Tat protein translocase